MIAKNAVRAGRASSSRISPKPIAIADRTIDATARKPPTTSAAECDSVRSRVLMAERLLSEAATPAYSGPVSPAYVDGRADGGRLAAFATSHPADPCRARRRPLSDQVARAPP